MSVMPVIMPPLLTLQAVGIDLVTIPAGAHLSEFQIGRDPVTNEQVRAIQGALGRDRFLVMHTDSLTGVESIVGRERTEETAKGLVTKLAELRP